MLFSKVVQHSHHSILEQLIKLRECCGGFGYLQVSGHPGCIERVALRASMREEQELVLEKQLLQVAHYYSSSD